MAGRLPWLLCVVWMLLGGGMHSMQWRRSSGRQRSRASHMASLTDLQLQSPLLSQQDYPLLVSGKPLKARDLNRLITAHFPPTGDVNLASLQQLLATHEAQLDHIHMLTLLHRCAKHHLLVEQVLPWPTVTRVMAHPRCRLDAQGISSALYALQHYSYAGLERERDLGAHLAVLGDKLEAASRSGVRLNGQAIANALYGLHRMTAETAHVRRIVVALAALVESAALSLPLPLSRHRAHHQNDAHGQNLSSSAPSSSTRVLLSGQELGSALWGLRGMSSDQPAVRRLVGALASCLSSMPAVGELESADECRRLSSQHVGMALSGLRVLSSEHAEVRALLAALLPRLADSLCQTRLDRQAVGAIQGLAGMDASCAEVQSLLTLLAAAIKASPDALGEQELSCALSGLRRMSTSHLSVVQILEALRGKTLGLASLSPLALGQAVHGLKSMASEESPAVDDMLAALAGKVGWPTDAPQWLSSQSLAMMLTGLRGMSAADRGTGRLLVATATASWVYHPSMAAGGAAMQGSEVGMALAGLRRIGASHESRPFLAALARRVALPSAAVLSSADFSAALRGLGQLSGEEGRALLQALVGRAEHLLSAQEQEQEEKQEQEQAADAMTSGEACAALYGLRGLLRTPRDKVEPAHAARLNRLVSFLSFRVAHGTATQGAADEGREEDFHGRSLAMALYALGSGLSHRSLPPETAYAALEAVLNRLRRDQGRIAVDPSALSMSLLSLRALAHAPSNSPLPDAARRERLLRDSLSTLTACIDNERQRDERAPITPTEARSVLSSLDRLGGPMEETRALLRVFVSRLRQQTNMEIKGAEANFIPVAPPLLGFFLLNEQLDTFWSFVSAV